MPFSNPMGNVKDSRHTVVKTYGMLVQMDILDSFCLTALCCPLAHSLKKIYIFFILSEVIVLKRKTPSSES